VGAGPYTYHVPPSTTTTVHYLYTRVGVPGLPYEVHATLNLPVGDTGQPLIPDPTLTPYGSLYLDISNFGPIEAGVMPMPSGTIAGPAVFGPGMAGSNMIVQAVMYDPGMSLGARLSGAIAIWR